MLVLCLWKPFVRKQVSVEAACVQTSCVQTSLCANTKTMQVMGVLKNNQNQDSGTITSIVPHHHIKKNQLSKMMKF